MATYIFVALIILFSGVGHADPMTPLLLGSHGPGLSPHPLLVVGPVLTKAGVGLGLSGILDVGVIEEVLDPQQDLLDGDGRPPVLLLVQDGQAN